mmetsp:Transcript_66691/g.132148  ORF Transcript_66691/g.132148 Transcript_66691/m.132148 type:complete len:116 (+) Transcript_66691:1363-1710(+)
MREWEANCTTFCNHLQRRRQNVTSIDHYALKFHDLRPKMDKHAKPLNVTVEWVRQYYAKKRLEHGATAGLDRKLAFGSVIIHHLMSTCIGNKLLHSQPDDACKLNSFPSLRNPET